MSLIVVSLFLVAIVIALFYFYKRHDADFTTLLYAKYGRKPEELKGKVVWIVGASMGIGKALATELASAGSRLVLSSRNAKLLEEVRAECLRVNKKLAKKDVLVLSMDVADIDNHNCLRHVVEHFGQLDILVNNAGRLIASQFANGDPENDNKLFAVNVLCPIALARLVANHWLTTNHKGHLVVNSSMVTRVTAPMFSTYAASKAALNAYHESLRTELSFRGIQVTVVCPGPVETDLQTNQIRSEKSKGIKLDTFSGTWMTTERCAKLFAVAVVNQLHESWISTNPFLWIAYANSFVPRLITRITLIAVNKERIAKIESGHF